MLKIRTAALALAVSLLSVQPFDVHAEESLNITMSSAPSSEQIGAWFNAHPSTADSPDTYAVSPDPANDIIGEMSDASKNNALNRLNLYRYTAGLETVSLNTDYGTTAQSAAALLTAVGHLEHQPAKPAGISQALYEAGYAGTSSSNLGMNYRNSAAAVDGYMNDSDTNNISAVGHRRWCLNQMMALTGFGSAGSFYAMYAFDTNRYSNVHAVMWPAKNTPEDLFENSEAWSVSFDDSFDIQSSEVSVSVVNNKTGTKTVPSSVYVNREGYGTGTAVIFTPNVSTAKGNSYTVTIGGVSKDGYDSAVYTADFTGRVIQRMIRMYNPNSGEHFFTADESEAEMLSSKGWAWEGEAWTAANKNSAPVYRLYNENGGEHHYTMNAAEKDMLVKHGWSYEGIGWYSDTGRRIPLYRVYNPNAFANNHHYTKDINERNNLIAMGWKSEGIAWYGTAE